jgi:hypothetical protein
MQNDIQATMAAVQVCRQGLPDRLANKLANPFWCGRHVELGNLHIKLNRAMTLVRQNPSGR